MNAYKRENNGNDATKRRNVNNWQRTQRTIGCLKLFVNGITIRNNERTARGPLRTNEQHGSRKDVKRREFGYQGPEWSEPSRGVESGNAWVPKSFVRLVETLDAAFSARGSCEYARHTHTATFNFFLLFFSFVSNRSH